MSRNADVLYFAPGIRFSELDLTTGNALPKQFKQRFVGFYLDPARRLAAAQCTFAAGLLVVCAMDALSLYIQGTASDRIRAFCRKIPELADDNTAGAFTENFRNGLVHQAIIKNGSEFNSDIKVVAHWQHGRLCVNPALLCDAVAKVLDQYIEFLNQTPEQKRALVKKIKHKFRVELTG